MTPVGLPPAPVAKGRPLTDRGAVALAVVAVAGALAARPVPWAVGAGGVAVALLVRRPWLLLVGVALLASTLSARAEAGLRPARPSAFHGTVTLVTDPEAAVGGTRAVVKAGRRRFELRAGGGAAGQLGPALAGERLAVTGRRQSGAARSGLAADPPRGRPARSSTRRTGVERNGDVAGRQPGSSTARAGRRAVAAGATIVVRRVRARRPPRPAGHRHRRLPGGRAHPPPRGVRRERGVRPGPGRASGPPVQPPRSMGGHRRRHRVLRVRHEGRAVGAAGLAHGRSGRQRRHARPPGIDAPPPLSRGHRPRAHRPTAGRIGGLPAVGRRVARDRPAGSSARRRPAGPGGGHRPARRHGGRPARRRPRAARHVRWPAGGVDPGQPARGPRGRRGHDVGTERRTGGRRGRRAGRRRAAPAHPADDRLDRRRRPPRRRAPAR